MKLLSTLSSVINEQFKPKPAPDTDNGNNNGGQNGNNEQGTFISPLAYNAMVNSPYLAQRWGRPHHGVDLQASTGTPLRSPLPGKVLAAGGCGGCGNSVTINHGMYNGKEVITRYCHMSSINVKVGDQLTQGQVFGKTGNTGNSDGPHLHFEIRENDKFVNPYTYMEPFVTLGTQGAGDSGSMSIGNSYCSGDTPAQGGGVDDRIKDISDVLPKNVSWNEIEDKLKSQFPGIDKDKLKIMASTGGKGWLDIYKSMVDMVASGAEKAGITKDE